jgi:hypothetical protein
MAYASVLAGASPNQFERSMVGRHKQTWRLREYHLLSEISLDPLGSDSRVEDGVNPLPGGDPLKSYFPNDTQLRETMGGLVIQYAGSPDPIQYHSFVVSQGLLQSGELRVRDVIIIGEVSGVRIRRAFLLFTWMNRAILPGANSDWWAALDHATV